MSLYEPLLVLSYLLRLDWRVSRSRRRLLCFSLSQSCLMVASWASRARYSDPTTCTQWR